MSPRDLLQFIGMSAMWGSSFILIRIASTEPNLTPTWTTFSRLFIGALSLFAVLYFTRQRFLRIGWPIILVALFNSALPFTLFAWGEQTVASNLAAILNTTTPLWSSLIDWALSGVKPRFLGLGLGIIGVSLAVWMQHSGSNSVFGIFIIGLGSLSYAVATIIAKKKLQNEPPVALATAQISLAGLMIFPFAVGSGAPVFSLEAATAIFALGIFGSGIAYILYFDLLTRISATQITAVTYIMPIWGIFWGLVAGETISPIAIIGIIITVIGLWILNRKIKSS